MKPSKEQIEAWVRQVFGPEANPRYPAVELAELAYSAGRKAGMEEAEALARSMFNRAADGDEIADAIRAAMEADK